MGRSATKEESVSFLKANVLKIAAIVVIFALAFGIYRYNSGGSSNVSRPLEFVCVETGEVFSMPRGKTYMPPLANPKTGNQTLVPFTRQDDKIFIAPAIRRAVTETLKDKCKAVNLNTFEVTKPH